jgi:hypothetical protein
MTRVLPFPRPEAPTSADRGRLMTPQEVADLIGGDCKPEWVVKNVTPRVQLSQRMIRFWAADVLAYLNGRRTA